jgi:hypothetical protein
MSDIDKVEVTFRGGPLDGFVELPISRVTTNGTPVEANVSRICASWGAAHREGELFVGTVMLLPAVPFTQHLERLVEFNQDVLNKYQIDSDDVQDRTLQIVCSYLGTDVVDTHKPSG